MYLNVRLFASLSQIVVCSQNEFELTWNYNGDLPPLLRAENYRHALSVCMNMTDEVRYYERYYERYYRIFLFLLTERTFFYLLLLLNFSFPHHLLCSPFVIPAFPPTNHARLLLRHRAYIYCSCPPPWPPRKLIDVESTSVDGISRKCIR